MLVVLVDGASVAVVAFPLAVMKSGTMILALAIETVPESWRKSGLPRYRFRVVVSLFSGRSLQIFRSSVVDICGWSESWRNSDGPSCSEPVYIPGAVFYLSTDWYSTSIINPLTMKNDIYPPGSLLFACCFIMSCWF